MTMLADRFPSLVRETVRELPGWLRLCLLLLWSLGCTLLLFVALIVFSENWTGGHRQAAINGGLIFSLMWLGTVVVGWSGRVRSEFSRCSRDLHIAAPLSPWGPWWLFWPLLWMLFMVLAVSKSAWLVGRFPLEAAQYDAHLERSATLTGGVETQVLHAAGEEFFYRGLMLVAVLAITLFIPDRRRWLRGVLIVAAVVVSVTAFAAHHSGYGMANVLSSATNGVVYAIAALVARSVWPAVAMHAGYNVAVLM